MTRASVMLRPLARPSPHEAELDRLADLRANGFISHAEYVRSRDAVRRAMKREAVR